MPNFITVSEAANLLGVSASRVKALIKQNKLKAEKPGRDWLIDKKSVLARKKPG